MTAIAEETVGTNAGVGRIAMGFIQPGLAQPLDRQALDAALEGRQLQPVLCPAAGHGMSFQQGKSVVY